MGCSGFRNINLTVVLVLFVFIFLYYVSVFCVIVPWLSFSVPGVTNLGVLTLTAGLSLYCYIFCVIVDAGSVPDNWEPDEEQQTAVEQVKRKGGSIRYCQKCTKHKPPRAHHCRVCQRCVLRMDHHCPWTNNCIGHANYRAFIMFLLYVNAALFHLLGLLASHAIYAMQSSQRQLVIRTGPNAVPILFHHGIKSVWLWVVLQTLAFAVALPLTIGLTMLFGWHINLIISNKTTIEYQEGVTARLKGQGGHLHHHPYDLGLFNNLHEIFGNNFSTWLCPPLQPANGGTFYPTYLDDQY